MALGPTFDRSLEQKDSRWFRILGFRNTRQLFFLQLVVAVSCSECIVCHFYISSSCLNPSKMNLQKDCLVTCKNLQLGGLQVVTSWFVQEFEGSFTWRWPWPLLGGVEMRFRSFHRPCFVVSDALWRVRHHCNWSQHRSNSGARSSMGFANQKNTETNHFLGEEKMMGNLRQVEEFVVDSASAEKHVKLCVAVDCLNTWITMFWGKVFCKPQEACRKKPIGDVCVCVCVCVCACVVFQCECWNIPQQSITGSLNSSRWITEDHCICNLPSAIPLQH